MKIGIITFNSAHNYGAVLQAWALQEKLKEDGHKVNVINYRLPATDNLYRLFKPRNPFKNKLLNATFHKAQYTKACLKNKAKAKKYKKFEHFINHKLQTTTAIKDYNTLQKTEFEFDIMIAGSDQIWNGGLTGGINPAYFLAFGNDKVKRVSYAASIGKDFIPDVEKMLFRRYLRNFDYISVREQKAMEEVVELTDKPVSIVLDPTLLLNREKYDKLKVNPKVNQEYIYVHNVHITKVDHRLNAMAEELSKRLGIPVVHNRADYSFSNELGKFIDGGPEEFLGWIANAKYVIANSFHATVFSIIYERDFITIPHFQNPERMRHLLDSLEIGNHLIGDVKKLPKNLEDLNIDYKKVAKLRSEQKKESIDFLSNAIKGDKTTDKPIRDDELYFTSKDPFACYGCGACKNICPTDAIDLVPDKEGFVYPVINDEKCIHCDKCAKVCIFERRDRFQDKDVKLNVYAAYNKNQDILKDAASGGIFPALAEKVIARGGKVVGVVLDENLHGNYEIASTKEQLKAMSGTKLIEADNNDVKVRTKELLDKGIEVLFTGTPCQIAGLYSYLGKEYETLTTMEVICKGVASPKVYDKYLQHLETHYNSKITSVSVSNKIRGWQRPYVCIPFESGEVLLQPAKRNNFYKAHGNGLIQRPSCYSCEFMNLKKGVADITIGDFKGISKAHEEIDRTNGVSLVKINSEKGQSAFNEIKEELEVIKSTYDAAYENNQKKPIMFTVKRNQLLDKIDEEEIDSLLKSFTAVRRRRK